MNIADIVKTLDGKLVAGGDNGRTVGAVVANDLMSDVLLNDADDKVAVEGTELIYNKLMSF